MRLFSFVVIAMTVALPGCNRATKLTKANFDKVAVGMSVAEVEAILGPGELDPDLNVGEGSTVAGAVGVVGTLDSVSTSKSKFQIYKWGNDKRWIQVTFSQGKVAPVESEERERVGVNGEQLMLHIPISRWGEPYKSLEVDPVVHFMTGETLAEVSRTNAALVERDMRQAPRTRAALREFPIRDLLQMVKKAGQLYTEAELPLGDGTQTPDQFVRMQSATTGLPEHMCRFNMTKNKFVLENMDKILDALTRGLDLDILSRGHGVEHRGVPLSYQAQSPVLGLVLPSNSPGVHTLWLPIIPLQVGLVLKPGPQEPWTPYRMASAFIQAGVPKQAIAIYPGLGDIGAAVLKSCPKSLIFGGTPTVEQYKGNPRVQAHGPGFSKIILGDDEVDNWAKYLDIMADSVFINSGRGCINCSGIWVSRHGRAIAEALAERLGPVEPLPPEDPKSALAAFTVPNQADGVWAAIEADLNEPGVHHLTAKFGPRLVKKERCDYLRPTVVFCENPDKAIAMKEYMFPFVTVVECPQEQMLARIGQTLVCSAITADKKFQRALIDAVHIDRLNIGPMTTIALNWLQPHEGSIVDFLFRARAFQFDKQMIGV